MWKLIFIGLIIWYVISTLKRNKELQSNQHEQGTSKQADIETMVECETCHLYLPKSEAILIKAHFYCCKEHATFQ